MQHSKKTVQLQYCRYISIYLRMSDRLLYRVSEFYLHEDGQTAHHLCYSTSKEDIIPVNVNLIDKAFYIIQFNTRVTVYLPTKEA